MLEEHKVYYHGSTETEFGTRVVAGLLERGWGKAAVRPGRPCGPHDVLLFKWTRDPEAADAEIMKAKIDAVRP